MTNISGDMEEQARRHLAQVGWERCLLESVEGMIESAIAGFACKHGLNSPQCDPALDYEYAVECFRQAVAGVIRRVEP